MQNASAQPTTADATIRFASSTDQFTPTADGPSLPGATTSTLDATPGTRATLPFSGLAPYTAYSVLIIATDSLGGTETWAARIGTPWPMIIAGIDRVHISGDGDDGSNNDGEIGFRFGTLADRWGQRSEDKLSSNTTVRLGRDSARALHADSSGDYDAVFVYAGERDGNQIQTCFIDANDFDGWQPSSANPWCGRERIAWSGTRSGSMTFEEIEALPSCAGYNVGNPNADRCLQVETAPNSSDQVSFATTYWFDINP